MLLPNKNDTREVRENVIELYRINEQFSKLQKEYNERKKKLTVAIKNYMYCNKGCDSDFLFKLKSTKDNHKLMSVKKVTPTTVVWDADKLEEALGKEYSKQVIDKTYAINDMDGLVSYLKSCGVNPKKFKTFIDVQKSVNVEVLEQLNAVGEIDKEDIKDCYVLDKKSSYLRLSVVEGEE